MCHGTIMQVEINHYLVGSNGVPSFGFARARVGLRVGVDEALSPAWVAQGPAELAFGLGVGGAAGFGPHHDGCLAGEQPGEQAGKRRGGSAPTILASAGSHSLVGAGSSSTML